MARIDTDLNHSLLGELPRIANALTADALRNGLNYYEIAIREGVFDALPQGLKSEAYKEAIAFIMAHDYELSRRYNIML